MNPPILALDMAGLCGVAHSDGYIDEWQVSQKGDDPKSLRLLRLYQRLLDMSETHPFSILGAEESAFGSPSGYVRSMHNELLGVLKLGGVMPGCPVHLYKPTTIKTFATGNGRADKADVLLACKKKLRLKTTSDNIADAAWVLQLVKRDAWK